MNSDSLKNPAAYSNPAVKVLCFLLAFLTSSVWGAAIDPDGVRRSIEIYDKLLTRQPDGENSLLIGDMRFKVETLRKFREALVAHSRRGVGPHGVFDFVDRLQMKWINGVVSYVFDTGFPDTNQKVVEEAMREWQAVASLDFRKRTTQKDYIVFKFNTNQVNDSFVGRIGGAQTINISSDAAKIICAHELGHALGMVHEQCRLDRDRFVQIHWANIDPEQKHNFVMVPAASMKTDYDLDSLMHYPRWAWPKKEGQLTMEVLPPNEKWSDGIKIAGVPCEEIGQDFYLSTGDKASMAAEYGAPLVIRGRAVDPAGRLLSGVSVRIEGALSPYRGTPNPVLTDGQGRFEFTGIPKASGKYTLNVDLAGTTFLAATREVEARDGDVIVDDFVTADTRPPLLFIMRPNLDEVLKETPAVSGIAGDSVGLREIRVALSRQGDIAWWDWKANGWGGATFEASRHMTLAAGTKDWSVVLPSLAAGGYQVHARAVDLSDNGSAWVSRHFFVDGEAPMVEMTYPVHRSRISGFGSIQGTASDGNGIGIQNGRVYFTLSRDDSFWTGMNWKSGTDANDVDVQLSADVIDGRWIFTAVPGVGHDGHPSDSARQGLYAVSVFARDRNGNLSPPVPGKTSVLFTVDWSEPSVSITSPVDGIVATNLPAITGTASDPGGITQVRLYLYRFEDGKFWDGNAWGGGGSAILPVTIDAASGTWTSSGNLPSVLSTEPSRKLSNGAYNVIAFAMDGAGNEKRTDSVFTVEFSRRVAYTAGSYLDNDPNNNNELWDNPANWDTGTVPQPEDTVVIATGNPTFSGSRNLHGLQISGGTLHGGRITIPAKGLVTWAGGGLNTDLVVEPGARFLLASSAAKVLGGGKTLDLQCDSRWGGASMVHGSGASVIRNTGLLSIEGEISMLYYNNGVVPLGTFRNEGTVAVEGGTLRFLADYGGWFFTNSAAIRCEGGSIELLNETTHLGGTLSGMGRVVSTRQLHVGTTTVLEGGTLELRSGELKGAGAFSGTGTFEWTGGMVVGDLTIGPEARLVMDGGDHIIATRARVRNRGRAEWLAGSLRTSGDSRFENSGELDIQGQVVATYYNDGVVPRGEFENTGRVTVGPSESLTFPSDYGGLHYNNNGETRVDGGQITLAGGGVSQDGRYRVDGGTVDWGASSERYVFKGTTTFSGSGRVRNSGGTLVHENARFVIESGGTYEQASGSSTGTLEILGPGTHVWSGGAVVGATTWSADLNTEISGDARKELAAGQVLNKGTVIWTGAGVLHANGGSDFRNEGLFEARSHSSFTYYNDGVIPRGRFLNTPGGVVRKIPVAGSSGATVLQPDYGGWVFVNQGTIDIQGGTWDLLNETSMLESPGRFLGAGSVRLRAGTTTVAGTNVLETGTVDLDGARLVSQTGNLRGPGTLAWSLGVVSGTLDVAVTNLSIRGPGDKVMVSGSVIRNAGQAQWTGTGPIRLQGDTFIENTGLFEAREDTLLTYYNNGVMPWGGFRNWGVFAKTGGTNATVWAPDYGGARFDNSGTIRMDTGRLELSGGGSWVGGKVVGDIAWTLVDLKSGVYTFTGTNEFAGPVRWIGAEIVTDGALHRVVPGGSIDLGAGWLKGSCTFNGGGYVRWSGGAISATVTLAQDAIFSLDGSGDRLLVGGLIRNQGNVNWIDGGVFKAQGGSLFLNEGRFLMYGDGRFTYYNDGVSPRGRFHNTGLMEKRGMTGQTRFEPDYGGWEFTSTGTIDIQSGTLSLTTPTGFTNTTVRGAGRIRVDGAALQCDGNIVLDGGTLELSSGSILGKAVYSGPGRLQWTSGEIQGHQTIAAGGTLLMGGPDGKVLASGATVDNRGTTRWTAGTLHGSGASRFLNGGVLEVGGPVAAAYYNNGVTPWGLFENAGSIRLTTAQTQLRFPADYGGWRFLNDGLLEIGDGRVDLPPTLELTPRSILRLRLDREPVAGPAPVAFAGAAGLQGALELSWKEGQGLVSTNARTVLTHAGRTGEFARVDLPIGDGGEWVMAFQSDLTRLAFLPTVVFENQIAPLGNDGSLQIGVRGPPSQAAILQGSVNLVDWVNIATNRPFTGQFQFSQPIGDQDGRFFRTIFVE